MLIIAGIVAFYTTFIYAWSKKARLSCRICDGPLSYGHSKYYCVGCETELDLQEMMKGNN